MNVTNADSKRINLISNYFKKAYDNDSKVVYVNALVPAEILMAMDIIPFNLGTVGGILAQGRTTTKFINLAEQNYVSSDVCSTTRCLMGAALNNALPTPDFLVLTSGPCDVDSHLIRTLSQHYGKTWLLLDIPIYYEDEEVALVYLENQIKNMVTVLEETLNLKMDFEKLKVAIAYSNETFINIEKINEFAKMIPTPLSIIESIDIVSSLHLTGSKEMAEIYREKHEELSKKIQNTKYEAKRKPRILWHGLRTYYTNEIFEHLENNCKVEILSESDVYGASHYGWDRLDPDQPYRSLAKKMIRSTTNYCTVNERFIRQIPEKIGEYSLDGVIALNSRGCRHLVSLNQVLRDIFSTNNLPFLEIDCDFIDHRDYAFEQMKTRIDAFAELLYGRI